MSLQDKLDAFRADFEAGLPPYNAPAWIHEPVHRATAELIAPGAAEKALKFGDRAPDFMLDDPDGNAVSSAALLAQGPLVATFSRGVWRAYCNRDLQALEAARRRLTHMGQEPIHSIKVPATGGPPERCQLH